MKIKNQTSAMNQRAGATPLTPRVPYKQRGMTLLEGLTWMALAGGVVAAALGMNAKGWLGNKEGTEIKHISTLVSNTKKLASVNGYGAAGTNLVPSLIAEDLVPSDMTNQAGVLVNRYGGTVTVVSTGLGYTITDPSLPTAPCMALAKQISASGAGTTKINTSGAVTGPVDSPTAQAQCTSATNTVSFTMAN